MQLERYIDHTLLKPTATGTEIQQLCAEAVQYGFYAVCVSSAFAALAKSALRNSEVKLAAVAGFPLGSMASEVKLAEVSYCLQQGIDEIDMVINIGWLKSGSHSKVREEIASIKDLLEDKVLKVIIETCYLTDDEKRVATEQVIEGGADFVKTSTGFGSGGATLEDIQLIKSITGDSVAIKASGGIRDRATTLRYIEMGVSRIGTSSGITIVSAT